MADPSLTQGREAGLTPGSVSLTPVAMSARHFCFENAPRHNGGVTIPRNSGVGARHPRRPVLRAAFKFNYD